MTDFDASIMKMFTTLPIEVHHLKISLKMIYLEKINPLFPIKCLLVPFFSGFHELFDV